MPTKVQILMVCLGLMCGWSMYAQGSGTSDEAVRPTNLDGFELDTLARTYIWFRHDVGVVDSNYMDNRKALASIRHALTTIGENSLNEISSILVEGTASPLGNEIYNRRLSYRRAQTVKNFLLNIPEVMGGA